MMNQVKKITTTTPKIAPMTIAAITPALIVWCTGALVGSGGVGGRMGTDIVAVMVVNPVAPVLVFVTVLEEVDDVEVTGKVELIASVAVYAPPPDSTVTGTPMSCISVLVTVELLCEYEFVNETVVVEEKVVGSVVSR
jgi:hypothetical protein